ncbi:MAG TPA: hypothetical protein VKA32_06220, partial [Gammaproteobacteria bacterium]|nr:hypothetical protein [Gammaproteobacteria bacterium]
MADVEKKEDFGTGKAASVGQWLAEIKAYDKTFKTWTDRSNSIVSRYRDETVSDDDGITPRADRLNILWSNVQTLGPALYSRIPKADITRRHKDKDPVARASAIILERACETLLEEAGIDDALRSARDDYLLTARGQVWVRYVPTYGEETTDRIFLQADTDEAGERIFRDSDGETVDEPQFDEAGEAFTEGEPYRPVVAETVSIDHINWADFGHTAAPNWPRVRAVWKREMMTRAQLNERFGSEVGAKVGMTRAVPNVSEEDTRTYGDVFRRAE